MDFLQYLERQWASIPLVVVLAVPFYIVLAAVIVVPAVRSRVTSAFRRDVGQGREYFPQLDAFRGFAALAVASLHIPQWLKKDDLALPFAMQGFKGVAVFCVLSGFVVYRSWTGLESRGGDALRTFAIRRILRIYPVYAVFLVTALAAGRVITTGMPLDTVIADFLMLRTFGYRNYINPVAWSLYAELLFYLALPVWTACAGRHRLVTAVVTLLLLCLAGGLHDNYFREALLLRYFFMGIVLSELYDRFRTPRHHAALITLSAGIMMLYADIVIGTDILGAILYRVTEVVSPLPLWIATDTRNENFTSVTLGCGIALVIYASLTLGWLKRLLSAGPLRVPGVISYSVYIWHGLIVVAAGGLYLDGKTKLAGTVAALAPSGPETTIALFFPAIITAAACSYLLIERPAIGHARRITPPPAERSES